MKKKSQLSQKIDAIFDRLNNIKMLHRIIIYIVTLVLLVGGLGYAFIYPKFDEIKELKDKKANLENLLAQAKIKAARLASLRRQLKEVEEMYAVALRDIPEKEEIPSLLTAISRSGGDAGLDFILFNPRPDVNKNFYAEIPVSMRVQGGYHNVALFFATVARLSRLVNIKDISMTYLRDSREVDTTCTAVTYKFIDASKQDGQKKGKKKK